MVSKEKQFSILSDSRGTNSFKFPNNINIIDFLKLFNGDTKKKIFYDDAEIFLSSEIRNSSSLKICVMITVYTEKLETLGVEKYSEIYQNFIRSLLKWVNTQQEELNSKRKEIGKWKAKQLEDRLNRSSVSKFVELFPFSQREAKEEREKASAEMLQAEEELRIKNVSIVKATVILRQLVQEEPPEYRLTKSAHLLINRRNDGLGMTKSVVMRDDHTDDPHKDKPLLQQLILKRNLQLFTNLQILSKFYVALLREFEEDILFAMGAAFNRLAVNYEPTSKDLRYCQMFCFVSDLLGLVPGLHLQPKIDFGLYFLTYTGATEGLNMKAFFSNPYQTVSQQVLLILDKSSPNNSAIVSLVEKVINQPRFGKHILRKLLWMTDHTYYYDKLLKLNSEHPSFEHRAKLRKVLEYKIISVSRWDGELTI